MSVLALLLAAMPCEGCHTDQHAQWGASRHATAPANPLFAASFQRHRERRWCLTCHVPQGEAITCASCHLPSQPHGAKVDERLCATCHDFDVPKAFNVGEGPMQNTWDEWLGSEAAREGKGCASCHDHGARSGHDAAAIRGALQLRVKREGGRVVARISAPGAGHAIPTGDPFRRLVLSAGEAKKKVQVPVGATVTVDLGPTPATRWQLTVFHAELEVESADHPIPISEGAIE